MMVRLMITALWVLGALTQSSSTEEPSRTTASPPSRTSATSSSAAVTHTIAVGATGHRFTENEIFANIGDTVEFLFYPANHSVIRAPYLHPCIPYEMSGIGRVGFNSGFKPVKAITTDAPRWSITINDTEPIFYYCGADGSCYKNHMIGVINPNATQTLEKHLESAEGLTFQVLPGEPYPEENGDDPTEPKPTTGGDGEQGPNSPPSGGGGDTGLNAGQIAGIAIGSAALLIIAASLIYLCGRRGGIDGAHRRIAFTGNPPPGGMTEENYTVGTKSPAADSSRWSAVRWSTRAPLSPYREQASPPGNLSMMASPVHAVGHPHPVYGFTGMEPQHPGHYQHASYMYDHAMKQQPNSPPPKPVASPPPVTPIELPSENGLSPGQARYSWVGNDSEANFRTR